MSNILKYYLINNGFAITGRNIQKEKVALWQTLPVVYLSSMGYADAKNDKAVILDDADYAIIADSVSPLSCPIGAQGLAMNPRIDRTMNVFVEPFQNHSPDAWIKFRNLFICFLREFEIICHTSSSSHPWKWFQDQRDRRHKLHRPL